MATLDEFKKNESTLYKKIYNDTLKDSISSYLDSQNRKTAVQLEKYMAELAKIYGEHIAKDTIYSGDMLTKNIAKKIERSLSSIKSVDPVTGAVEQKFYSIMELCKYPLEMLKKNKDVEWFMMENAVELAIAELEPLIENYYETHEKKNQEFNWDGYVNAYHKVLNKYVDQAARGNNYAGLLTSLKTLNAVENFAKSDDKYETMRKVREAYNDSTNFTNQSGPKESTGVYKIDTEKVLDSLYVVQMHLNQLAGKLPLGQNKIEVQNQIDYIERVIDVVSFGKNNSGTDLVRFFSKTDRDDMLSQFIKNMSSDWDIVASLSNRQCKKIMYSIDQYQSTKAYMAIKASIGQYVRENYERYVSEKALKDSNVLANELNKLSRFCEVNPVSKILKLGNGIPDTELRNILEDAEKDKLVNISEVFPTEIKRQIITSMANKNFLDNRALFNTWKYSTEQFIAVNDMMELKNGISENFENEHSVPKHVAMSILWENILTFNRINYYLDPKSKLSKEVSALIEELEEDGIYADWSDETVADKIWDGRSFEQELGKVENFYGRIFPGKAEEPVNVEKK